MTMIHASEETGLTVREFCGITDEEDGLDGVDSGSWVLIRHTIEAYSVVGDQVPIA